MKWNLVLESLTLRPEVTQVTQNNRLVDLRLPHWECHQAGRPSVLGATTWCYGSWGGHGLHRPSVLRGELIWRFRPTSPIWLWCV